MGLKGIMNTYINYYFIGNFPPPNPLKGIAVKLISHYIKSEHVMRFKFSNFTTFNKYRKCRLTSLSLKGKVATAERVSLFNTLFPIGIFPLREKSFDLESLLFWYSFNSKYLNPSLTAMPLKGDNSTPLTLCLQARQAAMGIIQRCSLPLTAWHESIMSNDLTNQVSNIRRKIYYINASQKPELMCPLGDLQGENENIIISPLAVIN